MPRLVIGSSYEIAGAQARSLTSRNAPADAVVIGLDRAFQLCRHGAYDIVYVDSGLAQDFQTNIDTSRIDPPGVVIQYSAKVPDGVSK